MRITTPLLIFTLGTWILALVSLVLWVSDYSRPNSCNGDKVILFALAALHFGIISALFLLFICRPFYPFGVVSSLLFALTLIQLPQLAMAAYLASNTLAESHCYVLNVATTLVLGLPWLWGLGTCIYVCRTRVYDEEHEENRIEVESIGRIRIHPTPPLQPTSVTRQQETDPEEEA